MSVSIFRRLRGTGYLVNMLQVGMGSKCGFGVVVRLVA
jgi:hypothetical protein